MNKEERFAFGENWKAFIDSLDENRINNSTNALKDMLAVESLGGKTFLDIGCGSGLSSLAAERLGASITAIDYDQDSVDCTRHVGEQFGNDFVTWQVRQGSVLDESLMNSLGTFDVVYSWGVLHHTGDMKTAIELSSQRVADGGLYFIAIYNDQGGESRRWLAIKRLYHRLPEMLRPIWVLMIAGIYEAKFALARLSRFKNPFPFADWQQKIDERGMSPWHDWVDWVGGLPFEVAKPEEIIMPLRQKGFVLENLRTVGSGWGCNEYVFRKTT